MSEHDALRPTPQAYGDWQHAFDFFNRQLWDGRLPDCIITMRNHVNSFGYFSKDRFIRPSDGKLVDEIAMNPGYFALRPLEITLSTLGHEMAHQHQAHFGTLSRKGYHNTQWADEMERIGLCPSATGLPGGRRTGQHVTHYIIADGLFDRAVRQLIDGGYQLVWMDKVLAMEPTAYQKYLDELAAGASGDGGASNEESGEPRVVVGSPAPTAEPGTLTAEPAAAKDPIEATGPAKAGRAKREPPKALVPAAAQIVSVNPAETGAPIDNFMRPSQRPTSTTTRDKFVCSSCKDAAWGKPSLNLICGACNAPMTGTTKAMPTNGSEP